MRRILLVIFCSFIFILFFTLSLPNGSSPTAYLVRGNVFSEYFKEPVEKLVFVVYNGKSFSFTNYDELFVSIVYEEFEYKLEKDGLTTKDFMCVIHNHITPNNKFTVRDIRFFNYLKSKGFRGWFLLWSSFRQCVVASRDGRTE